MELVVKENSRDQAETIINDVDSFITRYNEKSLVKNRQPGLVHNWSHHIEADKIFYEIDLGSADIPFLKKLLVHLSKPAILERIIVS